MLHDKFEKGCTLYPAKSHYLKNNIWSKYHDVIYTVFTRLEIAKLHTEIEKIDPQALVITENIKDIR